MRHRQLHSLYLNFVNLGILLACWFCTIPVLAQDAAVQEELPTSVMTDREWQEVDQAVERAIVWLVSQQKPDGSFPSNQYGQPGATGLCVMAFLSQGHLPGEGKYGDQLSRALDYIISCQKRSGILSAKAPNTKRISRAIEHQIGFTSVYNHAISGLVLSECYAMAGPEQNEKIEPVIEKALEATCQLHDFRKFNKSDEGGWRYMHTRSDVDADLSITGWQLMFLRSAKNAGFDVEKSRIDRAVKYVRRCFLKDRGTFAYKAGAIYRDRVSRGVAGSGILALAHSGLHDTPEAKSAGDWVLKSGFQSHNEIGKIKDIYAKGDRYYYGLLTCSPAMYQLGGRYWREFFPPAARVLLDNQKADGSWHHEEIHGDGKYGNAYTTAIGVIALTPTNQLLPIFQR